MNTNSNNQTDTEALRDALERDAAPIMARRDELLQSVSRAPLKIENAEQASKCTDLIRLLRACGKNADAERIATKEPYLAGGRMVDAVYKNIIEPVTAGQKTIEDRLTLWQRAQAEVERLRRLEAERVAQEAARKAAEEAAQRANAAQTDTDINAAIAAEETAAQMAAEAQEATQAANAKPAELTRARGEYGAVASLRTTWKGEITDKAALDLNSLRPYFPAGSLETALNGFVRHGGRELAGARIFEHSTTTVR